GLGERRILHRVRGKHELLDNLNPTTIKKWLRNPTVIGQWAPRPVDGIEQTPIEGVYPAIVSKELWYRVQKRLASPLKIKSASKIYLLSGLVKCGVCGANFCVVDTKRSPAVMWCAKRHRLGAAGCSNSRSLPYMFLDYIRSETYLFALQRAAQSQQLTTTEKRQIEVEGELLTLHKQSENVVEAIAEYGMLPAMTAKLAKIAKAITTLEAEQLILKATPAIADFDTVHDTGETLLDDDTQRLNALLQGVGYAINCNGLTVTVNEPSISEANSISSDAAIQTYEYLGVHRASDSYKWLENGQPFSMAKPNPAVDAKNWQEFLDTQPSPS
ncbi:MAG: recombinase family protein, partial [Pseudomonas sp.]|uniref:recombinase family protein n=1 Tax=Pseudomonas sp. TaxID=306 RepID=UPI003BB7053F